MSHPGLGLPGRREPCTRARVLATPPMVVRSDTAKRRARSRRVEYIRLLEQALSQLGFEGAAQQLEQESGVALEAPEIGRLRAAVLAGQFAEAVLLLGQLPLSDYEYRRAEFALLEQSFLEVRLHPSDMHGITWQQRDMSVDPIFKIQWHSLCSLPDIVFDRHLSLSNSFTPGCWTQARV